MSSSYYAVEITGHVITWVSDPYASVSEAEQAVGDLNYQADPNNAHYEMFTDYRPALGTHTDDIPTDEA